MADPERKARQTDSTEQDVVLAGLFLLMARQNQFLREKANQDELTGLFNRRGLEGILAQNQPPRAMLHADSTNLKKVNDTLGHDRGDEAIVATAQVLQASLRPGDVIARIGGDEFLILLDAERRHSTEEISSEELLENVLDRAAQETQKLLEQPENADLAAAGFDIAMGGAVWREGMSIDDLRADSDAAMYRVKDAQHAASDAPPSP